MTTPAPSAIPHPPSPASDASPVIRLVEVRKTYVMGDEEVHALARITLDIPRGGYWAIMGPSGSGKSTMLNLLGALDRPTSGRYFLNGTDVAVLSDDDLSDARLKNLGFVFQSFHLIPQLTVRENIELPLYYLGWESDAAAERAVELAGRVGLGERINHRPTELSGGQMQRVAIARALANDPPVILADEPTGNLDSATSTAIMDVLTELNAAGKTVILVTHEPDIAAYAGTNLHMRDGKIDRIDTR